MKETNDTKVVGLNLEFRGTDFEIERRNFEFPFTDSKSREEIQIPGCDFNLWVALFEIRVPNIQIAARISNSCWPF